MQWTEGNPPIAAAQTTNEPATAPTTAPVSGAPTQNAPAPTATNSAVEPTATTETTPIAAGPSGDSVKLTAAELQTYKPNEIGLIPIIEYHQLVKTLPIRQPTFVRSPS